MSIDTEFAVSAPTVIRSDREHGDDEKEALQWASRGTAASALKAAHIFGLMAESGHRWAKDHEQARIDSLADRGREAQFLRQAADRANEAGWPAEVSQRLEDEADSLLNPDNESSGFLRRPDDSLHGKGAAPAVAVQDDASNAAERFWMRVTATLHVAKNFENHDIKSAKDHRRASQQARAAQGQGIDGALKAARIYLRMADCGHSWEKNRELAKSRAKEDRREAGYSLFLAANEALADGRPDREVSRMFTCAYGELVAAGEPQPDLRVWLWPDGGEDARYNLVLARCYVQLGRHEEAERRAERAIWQKLIDAPYLSNHDRAVIENLGMRLVRDEGIAGIDC